MMQIWGRRCCEFSNWLTPCPLILLGFGKEGFMRVIIGYYGGNGNSKVDHSTPYPTHAAGERDPTTGCRDDFSLSSLKAPSRNFLTFTVVLLTAVKAIMNNMNASSCIFQALSLPSLTASFGSSFQLSFSVPAGIDLPLKWGSCGSVFPRISINRNDGPKPGVNSEW